MAEKGILKNYNCKLPLENLQPLKEKTVSGFKWSLLGQAIIYVVTLAGTIIMSRLLGPSQFGLFGMLTVFSSLASLFVGFGLSHVIVQNQSLDQRDLSSIFWLNVLLGISIAVLFFFSADAIAVFYDQAELASITRVFSLAFLIYGCSAVPLGLLSKRIEFKQLVISQLFGVLVSYTAGIAAAYYGLGVWSLVVQSLVNHLVYVVLNFYFSRWVPSLIFAKATFSKISKFARNLLPSQLLDFFALNLDMMLIGKNFGKSDLGYYGRASALVQMPVNSLGIIFNRTFFSVFAALQNDQHALSRSYIRAVKMLTMVLMPILLLTAILSEEIVLFLFDTEWIGMNDLVKILAIAAVMASYNSFNDSVIVSQGRTDLLLRVNVVEKVILIIGVVIGVSYGLAGIAYAKVISTAIMFIPKLVILSRISGISVFTWFSSHIKLFIGLAACCVIAFLLKDVSDNLFLALTISTAAAIVSNFVVLLLMKEPCLNDAFDFIKKIYKR